MQTYLICCPVDAAAGYQIFRVKAESEAEAIATFNKEGGLFDHEEVEVTELGEPEVVGTTEDQDV